MKGRLMEICFSGIVPGWRSEIDGPPPSVKKRRTERPDPTFLVLYLQKRDIDILVLGEL